MPQLVSKLIKFPSDWVKRIDRVRGQTPFNEFVREAVLERIGKQGLSEMPAWGQGRQKKRQTGSKARTES
jgi:hypothetical protein